MAIIKSHLLLFVRQAYRRNQTLDPRIETAVASVGLTQEWLARDGRGSLSSDRCAWQDLAQHFSTYSYFAAAELRAGADIWGI